METAYDNLRTQRLQLTTGDRQEEPSFKAEQLVWLKPNGFPKDKVINYGKKYNVIEAAARNHAHIIEQGQDGH